MQIDRRSEQRHATAERSTVILSADCMVSCIVTDISQKGARLGFGRETTLPQQFVIVTAGERKAARLMWQRGLVAGVKFEAA